MSTQSYAFVLSSKEINKRYNNALQYFQNHRDNAAQVEVNMILEQILRVLVAYLLFLLVGLIVMKELLYMLKELKIILTE